MVSMLRPGKGSISWMSADINGTVSTIYGIKAPAPALTREIMRFFTAPAPVQYLRNMVSMLRLRPGKGSISLMSADINGTVSTIYGTNDPAPALATGLM
jgi:hypothetical protein